MSSWELDTNADGYIDQAGFDADATGTTDMWYFDSNADGYYDQVGFDTGDDQLTDAWFMDPNLDGYADTVAWDSTGDGVADDWMYAPAGTSMNWPTAAVDPSAGQAIVGGDTADWTLTDGAGNPVGIEDVLGPSTVGGTGTGWYTTDAAGNVVNPGDILPGSSIAGPTTLDAFHRAFVQAQQTGSFWDQLTIWNAMQAQHAMVYNGLAFM